MNWKGLLTKGGGLLATALAIPTGGMSTAAWNIAKKLTGLEGDDEATKNKAAQMIAADPALQMDFTLRTEELAIEKVNAYLKDVQNAREMNIKMKDSKYSWIQPALALLAVAAFIVAFYVLFKYKPQEGSRDLIVLMIGFLGSTYKDVYAFFFGSSQGSRDKDLMIGNRGINS